METKTILSAAERLNVEDTFTLGLILAGRLPILKEFSGPDDIILVGGRFDAEVTGVADFGVFVTFQGSFDNGDGFDQKSVDSLIHTSNLNLGGSVDHRTTYAKGQKVKVEIIDIDQKANRIFLTEVA